ncbi:MAG: TldD/PmbA family protein [Chloroflexota bacterium]
MIGPERFRAAAQRVLRASTADQTEVVLLGTDSALTRFASSQVHQNVSESNAEIRVRAIVGRRAGVATTNDLSDSSLDALSERAIEIARLLPEDAELPRLSENHPEPAGRVDDPTATCSPSTRATMVKVICDLAVDAQLDASGALTTERSEIGVLNSEGTSAYDESTRAHLVTVIMGAGSGYAERSSGSIGTIDAEAVGREAVSRALRNRDPIRVEPGEYQVVLEEYAVGEVLTYLAYIGFSAQAVQEGRGFMAGRLGQQIMDPRISIWDDAFDASGIPTGFDYEGATKHRVDLIQNGVANAVVHDARTARKAGVANTGHGLPAPSTFGPFPGHLFMTTGDVPRQHLAHGIDRGIWVTRFHYVNVAHPERAMLTGMTRDGTFLIEHGEITRPVANLRFTQSFLESFSALRAISRESSLIDAWGGVVSAPAVALDRFTFTGVTGDEAV